MIDRRWVGYGPPNYPFVLNRESNQAGGLVGWWPTLGNRGAGILQDLSGFGNGLSLVNSPDWVPDTENGSALEFITGNSDYLSATNIITGFPFTLSTRIKYFSGDGFGNVIGIGRTTSQHFYQTIEVGVPTSQLKLVCGNGTFNQSNPAPLVINDGAWHTATGVFISATEKLLYVDGELAVTYTANIDFGTSMTEVRCSRLAGFSHYLTGKLADIRIYNRALIAAEVYQLYAPQTRWELYLPIQRDAFAFVAAAGLGPVYPGRNHPSRNVSLRL